MHFLCLEADRPLTSVTHGYLPSHRSGSAPSFHHYYIVLLGDRGMNNLPGVIMQPQPDWDEPVISQLPSRLAIQRLLHYQGMRSM